MGISESAVLGALGRPGAEAGSVARRGGAEVIGSAAEVATEAGRPSLGASILGRLLCAVQVMQCGESGRKGRGKRLLRGAHEVVGLL